MSGRRQFGALRKLPSGRWQVRYRDGAGRLVPAAQTFERKGDAHRFLATVEADQLRGRSSTGAPARSPWAAGPRSG